MTASQNYIQLSPQAYLESERLSGIKHEYINGEVYAMAGASKAHVTIAGNIFALLRNHVRGSACRTYMADMKVRVERSNAFYYPDVVVTCDNRDRNLSEDFICYPSLIIEVLSTTTEAFDRGNKFADYRTIETLQEYVLVSQERINIECFRLNQEGRWVLYPYGEEEDLYLSSIDFSINIRAIYEDAIESGTI
jgi:Uma2 family endonuclease